MRTANRRLVSVVAGAAGLALAGTAMARPGPDVTLQSVVDTQNYGQVNGVWAYALGSGTCNIGNQNLMWLNGGSPALAMNAYRLYNGRLMQIGLGNCKTACCAGPAAGCGSCNGIGGNQLGSGCHDTYGAGFNGGQPHLAPRSVINGYTGAMTTYPQTSGDAIFRRLQIHQADITGASFPGALYFVEGEFIGTDDAAAGNAMNNATYSRVTVDASFNLNLAGTSFSTIPAIQAWHDHGLGVGVPDPSVTVSFLDVPGEGRFYYGYKATDIGGGQWRYDYAVFNLNSDRSGGSFSVPVASNVVVSNVGFNAPQYHSGELYDNAPWVVSTAGATVTWSSPQTYAQNPNSNALRWGTMYNFWFEANAGPQNMGAATLGLFKPNSPDHVNFDVILPGPPPPITIVLPGGAPPLIAPGTPTNIDFQVQPGTQNVVAGSPTMLYRFNGMGSYISLPASSLGGANYRAVLPGGNCGETANYYFTAMGDGGAAATLPRNAPTDVFSSSIATVQQTVALNADFEGTLPAGWTATGLWHVSGACAPTGSPCTGTQWAYYGQDATCTYNTGVANQGDLTSPPIVIPPAPPGGAVTLTYCSALTTENSSGHDLAQVLVNGTVVDNAVESGAWQQRMVDLASYAGQTVTLKFRFNTVDGVFNNFRGWQLDNVRIVAQSIGCPTACYANCDGSTAQPVLNVNDFICFQSRYAAGDSYANCDGSTMVPVLNVNDFICFQTQFAGGCH